MKCVFVFISLVSIILWESDWIVVLSLSMLLFKIVWVNDLFLGIFVDWNFMLKEFNIFFRFFDVMCFNCFWGIFI